MTIQEKAKKIIELVGGEKNIHGLTHCVTRLRFNLNDSSKAKISEIKSMEGILGVQEQGGQTQVIIGGEVGKVYREILKQYPKLDAGGSSEIKQEKKSFGARILDALSSILVASLHPIVGGGMLKGFVFLFEKIGLITNTSDTYLILNLIADCMFYFFPFLLAVSSARRFKTNEYMALALAGALMYPSFMTSEANPIMFLGFIPITVVSYSGSVLPIILGVLAMSYIFRFFDEKIPSMVNIIFVPLLTLIITIPLMLFGLAPLGYYAGNYIAMFLDMLINFAPWLAGFIVSATRPFLVLAGMHHAIRPLSIQQISTYGYTTIGAMNFMSTMAQASAALAIYVAAKNKNTKQIALSSTISGYLGITEPAIYGIIFKYRAAMIGTFFGAGIGGMVGALFGSRAYASVMPSLLSIPVYLGDGSTVGFFLGLIASIVATFVITVFLSKSMYKLSDNEEKEASANTAHSVKKVPGKTHTLYSPVKGNAIPMKEVSDVTFASEVLGKGVAVMPKEGKIYAPVDAEVATVFVTKHALGLQTASGVEILIHVGVNTVTLEGRHFTAHCKDGDKVRKGDLLLEFDRVAIEKEGLDTCVIMLVSNTADYLSVLSEKEQGDVAVGDKVVSVVE